MQSAIQNIVSGWILLIGNDYAPGFEALTLLLGTALCLSGAVGTAFCRDPGWEDRRRHA